jgi:hypothetical protein
LGLGDVRRAVVLVFRRPHDCDWDVVDDWCKSHKGRGDEQTN